MGDRLLVKITRENLPRISDRYPFVYLEYGRLEVARSCKFQNGILLQNIYYWFTRTNNFINYWIAINFCKKRKIKLFKFHQMWYLKTLIPQPIGVFPACAGVFLNYREYMSKGLGFPRMRGGVSIA